MRHTSPIPVSRLPDNVQPSRTTAISKLFQMQFKPAGLMEIYTSCRFMNCAAHLPDSRFPSPGQRTAISDNCYFKVVSNAVQARRANAGWVGGNKKSCRSTNCAAHLPDSRFPSPGQRTAISDNCYFKVVSPSVQARRANAGWVGGNKKIVPLHELCGTPPRLPFPVSRTTYSHLGQLLFQSCFKCSSSPQG